MKSTVSRDLVLATLSEFPDAGSRTVAEVLAQRHPRVFRNVESARDSVRHYRGNKGRKPAIKEHVRPNGAPGKSFPDLPEGMTSYEDWGALEVAGPVRALILSDVHIPYQDKSAIETSVARGADAGLVILNGDILDCYELSDFQKDPRKCDFPGALRTARELLEWLRYKFPKARIIMKGSNHEARFERYLFTRAPVVIGVPDFEIPALLKLDDLGIEWLAEKRPVRLGKLFVLHGDELGQGGGVNPARALFLKAKVHALEGHFHRKSHHEERNLKGETIATWSIGCLCDLHPAYAPHNDWSHGAAIVDVGKDSNFKVDSFSIIDGQVY